MLCYPTFRISTQFSCDQQPCQAAHHIRWHCLANLGDHDSVRHVQLGFCYDAQPVMSPTTIYTTGLHMLAKHMPAFAAGGAAFTAFETAAGVVAYTAGVLQEPHNSHRHGTCPYKTAVLFMYHQRTPLRGSIMCASTQQG